VAASLTPRCPALLQEFRLIGGSGSKLFCLILSFARHWHRAGPGAVHSGYIALGDPTDLATAWPARERMAMLYTPQSVAEALYGRKQASK